MEFIGFPKIARLNREIVVTEKIDGTNGVIGIGDNGEFFVGSRTRWLNLQTGDNHGFLMWALTNKEELLNLGVGRHYGEWWGSGIQRGYGFTKGEKYFSLFNTTRWNDDAKRPACCLVTPELYRGIFNLQEIEKCLAQLKQQGSFVAPGFMRPEGVIIFHTAQGNLFKKTIEKDELPKTFIK